MTRLMRPKEVAEILAVSTRTVERWLANGTLQPVNLPCGKRVSEEAIKAMLAKSNPDTHQKEVRMSAV